MKNLLKILLVAIVLFGGRNLFAQPTAQEGVSADFKKINVNQDAAITPDEIQIYQMQKFHALDKDNNGTIERKELEISDVDPQIRMADKDQDGKVTQEESNSQFSEYFKQLDKNQDGKVTEAEYTDYWKAIYRF